MSEMAPRDGEPTAQEIGQRIEGLMQERGRKPEWLATQADVSISTLRRWFDGNGEPSFIEMVRVAEALKKPLRWFATGDPDEPDDELDKDIRRMLLSHKQRRVKELAELDALLGRF